MLNVCPTENHRKRRGTTAAGRYRWLFCLAVASLILLVSCQGRPAETSTPIVVVNAVTATAPGRFTATPSATARATSTEVAAATVTPLPPTPIPSHTPSPTVIPTVRATRTAGPTNTPRPTATVTATALPMLFEAAVPPGLASETTIYDTWVDPTGRFWLATAGGLFVYESPNWLRLTERVVLRLWGADQSGRVWAGSDSNALYYPLNEAEPAWHLLGAETGWQAGLRAAVFSPDFGYSEEVVQDNQGRVWLVRNGILYQFEPVSGRWTVSTPDELGFVSAIGNDDSQSLFLTDVALDSFGNVWLSHCASQGLLFTGEGVRWYNGETWAGTPEAAERCILDIEVDSSGRVWLAGWRVLLRYDPADGTWTSIELPPWPNPLMVVDLTLDSHDNPWIAVIKATGGNWQGSGARYHWTDAGWQSEFAEYEAIYGEEPFSGPFGAMESDVAFSADGDAWVCDLGTVYAFSPAHNGLFSQVTPFYAEGVCQVQVDGNGRVWLAHIGRGLDLWYYDPE